MSRIRIAESDEEIDRCFPTMAELRTHLVRADFVPRVRRQQRGGFLLAYLEDGGAIRSVAGFRIVESLSSGLFLYVDDLVTGAEDRSRGHGGELFDWLTEYARSSGCEYLQLDSGVQRFGAHRFYLMKRMRITSHHFVLKLD